MRTWPILLGLVATTLTAPRALAQVEASEPQGEPLPRDESVEFEALLARLGDPPREEDVKLLVRHARVENPQVALALAEELSRRTGCAVGAGLLALGKHRDPSVRFAAIRGFSEVALRREGATSKVRAAIRDTDADVRTAAFQALGRVGDAFDLPMLFDALASDEVRTRGAALRAITTLTGVDASFEDATRWSDWWTEARTSLPPRLEGAIRRLDLGGAKADLRDARGILAKYTWIEVDKVTEAVRGWLRSPDTRRRLEGYRAAARCRLGDLAEDVRQAARDELDPDVIAIAARTARVLGIPLEGVAQPKEVVALVALLETMDDDAATPEADGFTDSRVASGDGGSPVRDNLAEKRERNGSASSTPNARDPRGESGATSLLESVAWIGFPLLAATISLATAFSLRRRRDRRDDDRATEPTKGPAEAARDRDECGVVLAKPR